MLGSAAFLTSEGIGTLVNARLDFVNMLISSELCSHSIVECEITNLGYNKIQIPAKVAATHCSMCALLLENMLTAIIFYAASI